ADLHFAAQHVLDHADAFARHLHAHYVRLAGGDATLRLLGRDVHAMTVVARGFLAGHLLGADRIQALGGAEAREGVALGDQLVRVFLVDRAPLALPIRTVRTADIRALVPLDTQPAQRVIDLLLGFAGRTHLIGVLDTQNELTAMLTGKAEVEQGDVGSADVRIAGGRRRNAGTNGGHGDSRKEGKTEARCYQARRRGLQRSGALHGIAQVAKGS